MLTNEITMIYHEKKIKTCLIFTIKPLNKPQDFGLSVLWTDEREVEHFGSYEGLCKTNTTFRIWWPGSALEPEQLAIVDGTMTFAVDKKILKENDEDEGS